MRVMSDEGCGVVSYKGREPEASSAGGEVDHGSTKTRGESIVFFDDCRLFFLQVVKPSFFVRVNGGPIQKFGLDLGSKENHED